MMVIRALVRACLFAACVSAQTISEQGQTVIDIAETSRGRAPCASPTAAVTIAPSALLLQRDLMATTNPISTMTPSTMMASGSALAMSTTTTMSGSMMSMSMSMMPNGFPDTMTMIQNGETVVEVVTTDSSGDMGTQILSTVSPTSTPSGNHSRNVAAIAGGVVGGVVAVATVVIALLLCRRRNRNQPNNGEMFMVGPADYKPSIDSMRSVIGQTANTVPTPLTYGADGQHSTYLSSVAGITASTDPDQPTPLSSKQEAARQQRQRELELQMRYLQDEMRALGPGPEPSLTLSPERAEDARQMEMMREQIALLQAQQQSSWAQGLTDEPPPGYTANTVVSRVATPEIWNGMQLYADPNT